jgi:hypothetical protein
VRGECSHDAPDCMQVHENMPGRDDTGVMPVCCIRRTRVSGLVQRSQIARKNLRNMPGYG